MNDDNIQALKIELQNSIASGWSLHNENGRLIVTGPDTPSFISEVWRLARFIAYDDYVCITREVADTREYRIASHSRRGLAFEVRIRAVAAGPINKGEVD